MQVFVVHFRQCRLAHLVPNLEKAVLPERARENIDSPPHRTSSSTARSLAGLIAIQGILKAGSPIGVAELFDRYKKGNEESIWKLREVQASETPAS
ncbi:hypothetical protein H8B02_09370 [Bradyrhizobium sp. Pear77]|uniref:DUF2235 domain-containing protein n=1 Tax=Bradyrhizobium altum TaxID=1571202 RepID=UPI001E390811|nr:DUF2235 domain-containing protein [Bradyrhizobium altum]MCC8953652.1 hypothetical protein [Bradyrhizobium altum]